MNRDQVWSPIAAIGGVAEQVVDDGDGVVGLTPGAQREDLGPIDHTGGFQCRDDQGGVGVDGHHEHREALERHGLVAAEVGQIGADGQQEGVDALIGHGGAGTRESLGEHRVQATALTTNP